MQPSSGSERQLPPVGVAVPGVVGAHLVLGGEHLPTAPTRKLPWLVDILEMSLHGTFALEPFVTLRTGNSVIVMSRNPDPGTLLSGRLSF